MPISESALPPALPCGASPDWTVPQDWAAYGAAEHAVWDHLFQRQLLLLQNRATPSFLRGLDLLRLSKPGIPDFTELNDRLARLTGWTVVAVPGLVPDAVFFEHLAHRRFVAGRFIRTAAQIDYLQEPDIFHDVFGHVPLLADPAFADYMQAYGQGGLRSVGFGALDKLARLYWYTVEFGLVQSDGGLKLYGAGIVSSHGESLFAHSDPSPHRIGFDLRRVLRTRYRIDDYQQSYFVIDSFEHLLRQTLDTDFAPLYAELASLPDLASDALLPDDRVLHRGSQAYAAAARRRRRGGEPQ
jgi:phenylalanine-4-hydroxylase